MIDSENESRADEEACVDEGCVIAVCMSCYVVSTIVCFSAPSLCYV